MTKSFENYYGQFVYKATLHRWADAAREAEDLRPARLRRLRNMAHRLRVHLDRVLTVAEMRLSHPLAGANTIVMPPGFDWTWRPELWRYRQSPAGVVAPRNGTGFGEGATLHHDCDRTEMTLRQVRNLDEDDLAPFGLQMEVLGFDGSFLSLTFDLPQDGIRDLRLRHVIRLDALIELERPIRVFARLNVKHGPNVDELLSELPVDEREVMVEFDLAYIKMNEKRLEKIWIDLIFEAPGMNRVLLRDVTLSRRPRADL